MQTKTTLELMNNVNEWLKTGSVLKTATWLDLLGLLTRFCAVTIPRSTAVHYPISFHDLTRDLLE